jgi:hypothetical protein
MPKINQTRPPITRIVGKPHRELVGSAPGARPSVLDRIRPISFDESDGIRMMVYGRSGTGKTTYGVRFRSRFLPSSPLVAQSLGSCGVSIRRSCVMLSAP